VTVFRFVEQERAAFPVTTMCRVLGVSPSGFWARSHRPASARSQANVRLAARIGEIHARSRGTYGVPRVHAELHREDGLRSVASGSPG
jgi:putative transposase